MEWLQTYKIGKALIDSGQSDKVDAFLVKYLKPKNKNGEEKKPYIVEIIVNIDDKNISIEYHQDYSIENIKTDLAFQSISGRTENYLLSPVYGDKGLGLKVILNFFSSSFDKQYKELYSIEKLKKSELVNIRNSILNSEIYDDFDYALKNIKNIIEKINDKQRDKIDTELEQKFIEPVSARLYLSGNNATDYVPYVRLKLIQNKKPIYLNRHPEYQKYIIDRYILELANLSSKKPTNNNKCYFSGELNAFPVRFPRDFTNILRSSTDTNTIFRSYLSSRDNNGDRFLVSIPIYIALKTGARFIDEHLKIYIADMPHYVIPDFFKEFNLKNFRDELNKKIDLAFQDSKYKKLNKNLESISSKGLNSLTFIGFEASSKEKTIDLKNRIQAIKPDRFNTIIKALNDKSNFLTNTKKYKSHNRFNFGTLYTLIPEKKKTTYTLSIIKSLLENHPIEKEIIWKHYSRLIHFYWYGKPDKKNEYYSGSRNIWIFKNLKNNDVKSARDRAINIATLKYLILISTIENLYNNKDETIMEENLIQEKPKTAKFFKEFNFETSPSKMAIFYLGKLLRVVAEAQSGQGSKHKPILNRVPFEGMDLEEIKRLKNDLVKKMVQYQKSQKAMFYGETDLKHFEYYFCKAYAKWDLTETENIFYLFTGYSMFWEVKDKKDIEDMKEAGFETMQENDNEPDPKNNQD